MRPRICTIGDRLSTWCSRPWRKDTPRWGCKEKGASIENLAAIRILNFSVLIWARLQINLASTSSVRLVGPESRLFGSRQENSTRRLLER
ncbi:unnamed protein product [Protopolystoma xenopodis]|uniref:Uncharacterized protein n=1 Tax=Protopolystoma xenopodis TaxID=117903 RepID=A0A448WBU8_9PLAT|nr:unnamed protein product [Protopolystoma xenopodis]